MVNLDSIRAMLIGATVKSLGRAVDMGVLELVVPRGEAIGIHLQCPFRIQGSDAILIGSRDMNFPQLGAGQDAFDKFATVFDARAEHLTALLRHSHPVVQEVMVTGFGDLMVTWTPGHSLSAFINSSGRIESWRVLTKGGEHQVFPVEAV